MNNGNGTIRRGTGLLVIEVINSNPNGDPDKESDPRIRPDEHGEISPVSVKRKIRDLIDDKDGPVWQKVSAALKTAPDPSQFYILESRSRDWKEVKKDIAENAFLTKYWDARFFGNTFLEKGLSDSHIRSGACQFGLGVSIAPVQVERLTTTKKVGAQEDKTRGLAPLGYRVVEHGVYVMPFFISASAAKKGGCTYRDVEVLQGVIPYTYSETSSYVRTNVRMRHAWYIEHKSPLGSAGDFELIEAMMPKKNGDPKVPSRSWAEYEVPTSLPETLAGRVMPLRDLVAEAYAGAGT